MAFKVEDSIWYRIKRTDMRKLLRVNLAAVRLQGKLRLQRLKPLRAMLGPLPVETFTTSKGTRGVVLIPC